VEECAEEILRLLPLFAWHSHPRLWSMHRTQAMTLVPGVILPKGKRGKLGHQSKSETSLPPALHLATAQARSSANFLHWQPPEKNSHRKCAATDRVSTARVAARRLRCELSGFLPL
jgi:hypothetical protein